MRINLLVLTSPILPIHHRNRLSPPPPILPPAPAPTIPPIAAPSFCNRPIYTRLTTFHASMYFSMHPFRQPCSLLESEDPGLVMQEAKQTSLMLVMSCRALAMLDWVWIVVRRVDLMVLEVGEEELEGEEELGEDEELEEEEKGLRPEKDIVGGFGAARDG